jgi:hypothetical protein
MNRRSPLKNKLTARSASKPRHDAQAAQRG